MPILPGQRGADLSVARVGLMKIIHMPIDEALLIEADRVILELHTTRSAFIREALEAALRQHAIRK
jgi:metal-responsive CopG/Arc/MetJ family transcriptional regulator